jgi:hypothetical protein
MSKGHEPHQVDAPTLHKLGMLFTVLLILILCVMYVLWEHVHPWTLSARPQVIPPSPRLQVMPPVDRAVQYGAQAKRLKSYGWDDADHRVAHIPIERAMELMAGSSSQQGGGR